MHWVIYESGHVGAISLSWWKMCYVVFFSISDQLSYRWFTRSNVSGVNSVNLMANWLAICCRRSGASLPVVTKWYWFWVDSGSGRRQRMCKMWLRKYEMKWAAPVEEEICLYSGLVWSVHGLFILFGWPWSFDPALMVFWGSCMSFVLNREGWRSGSLYNWWRLQVFHSICGRQG